MEVRIEDIIDVVKDTLNNDEQFLLPLRGTSMLPFLKTNDKALLNKVNKLKKRDVIFYQRDDGFVLHRIIKLKNDVFYVTGDNQYRIELVYPNQVIGVMVAYQKHNKLYQLNAWYRFKVFCWCIMPVRKLYLKIRYRLTK